MRVLLACLLAFSGPAFADDWTETINRGVRTARSLVAAEKGVPRDVANQSLCIVVLPWVDVRSYLMNSKGEMRIVATTGQGAALCRTGATWSGPWSRTWLVEMEIVAPDADQWGEKTEILLFVQSRTAAEQLRSGGFVLQDLKVRPGDESPADKKSQPDVIAFSRSWRPTMFGRGRTVTEREVKRFGGLALGAGSIARVSADNAKLNGTRTAREILAEPLPEADRPLIMSWKTEDEYWSAYRAKVMGGTYRVELSDEVAALAKKDNLTRWGIALAGALDKASPTPDRKITFLEPKGSLAAATTRVRGTLAGFREVRGVRLAGLDATLSPIEGGLEFSVTDVPLKPGENLLTGMVEEVSGVQEPIQTTVIRTAAKARKPAKPQR